IVLATGAVALLNAPMIGRFSNAVWPEAGTLSSGPLTRVAPPPTPRINPSSEKKLSTTSPALATVNVLVKTAWNVNNVPRPASTPLPLASMVPVTLPFRSVVTSKNGRVLTPIPEVLPGMVPAGGWKLIVGNDCVNAGVAVAGVLNAPEPSEVKKRAKMVLVEMFCTGVTQLTIALFETAVPDVAWTVSLPL